MLRLVLLTSSSGIAAMRDAVAERPWVTPIVVDTRHSLVDAFEQLRAMGVERISAVGGRGLATDLIDAGLVQDLYLTTSPITGGEPGTPIYSRPLDLRTVVRKRGRSPAEVAAADEGHRGGRPVHVRVLNG